MAHGPPARERGWASAAGTGQLWDAGSTAIAGIADCAGSSHVWGCSLWVALQAGACGGGEAPCEGAARLAAQQQPGPSARRCCACRACCACCACHALQGRSSIIVFCMAAVLGASSLLLGAEGLAASHAAFQQGTAWAWGTVCGLRELH